MTYANGDVYRGGYKYGKRHGVGRMRFSASSWMAEYSGQFFMDTMVGNTHLNGCISYFSKVFTCM